MTPTLKPVLFNEIDIFAFYEIDLQLIKYHRFHIQNHVINIQQHALASILYKDEHSPRIILKIVGVFDFPISTFE